MRLLLRQKGQKPTERCQDGQSGMPAIAVAGAEKSGLPYHVRRSPARRQLTMYCLGDDQAEIVAKPIFQPLTPMLNRIGVAKYGLYPNLDRADLDRASRHIICP